MLVASDHPVPMGPAASYWDEKRRRGDDQEVKVKALMAWMKRAFERRAAWSKRQLEDRDVCSTYLLKDTLVVTAYYLTDGPLRDQWVRWGFDPSKDPQSRLLQPVQVRMSSSYWRALNARVWSKLGNMQRGGQCINLDTMSWAAQHVEESDKEQQTIPLVLFETRVKGSFAFQLCNLHAEPLLEMVAQAKVLSQWDHGTGWYSETTLDLFAVRVLQYLEQKINAFVDKFTTHRGTLLHQVIPRAEVVSRAPRKEFEEQPGFSHQLWEWQERYEQLPVIIARTQKEISESEQYIGCLVHPKYRGFKKLGVWTNSVLKKILTAAARATNVRGSKSKRTSSADMPRAGHVELGESGILSAESSTEAQAEMFDYKTISASEPFDTFDNSGSSESESDSDSA